MPVTAQKAVQETVQEAVQDDRLRQIVDENAEIKALFLQQAEADRTNLHLPIERFAKLAAQPAFIVTCLCLFGLWIAVNTDLHLTGHRAWDQPPFFWLQGLVTGFSLIITVTILIAQSRQGKIAEQRADLQLQVILLIGQRSAKLIELTEELRRDLPNVHDRHDEQAEVLQQVMTPDEILKALKAKDEG